MAKVTEPLFLDSGNSRLKWSCRAEHGVFNDEGELLAFISSEGVNQIVLSTVTARYTAATIELLDSRVKVHQIGVLDNCLGLKLAYKDISKLGVDRWLNMLAIVGEQNSRANIVVSMGTAMTVDVINRLGEHVGGYIVPGLQTQLHSLGERASALPVVEIAGSTDLGVNTDECIGHGVLKSSCSLVEVLAAQWRGEQPVVTVTGGDGAILSESLNVQHDHRANLMFDGMKAYWRPRENTTE